MIVLTDKVDHSMGIYHYELAIFVSKQTVVQLLQMQILACNNSNFLFGTIQKKCDWRKTGEGARFHGSCKMFGELFSISLICVS